MTKNLQDQLAKVIKKHKFECKDLLSIDDLSLDDIEQIFALADIYRERGTTKEDLMKGVSIANVFLESSTRTHSSFEWAGKHLGADTINVGGGTTEKKGENIIDLIQNLDVMGPEIVIVRTSKSGLPMQIARHTAAHVVNAGDGIHEHPSQALLDLYTMIKRKGSIKGKIVTVIGDIKHSRVFGSLGRILQKHGAIVRIAAPATLIPEAVEEVYGVSVYYDVEEALRGADVVYALRVQGERGATGDIPTIREYSKAFGISAARFALAKKDAILLHPGPVQRDIDVHHALSAIEQSAIWDQAQNGLYIRKAILTLMYQSGKKEFTRI